MYYPQAPKEPSGCVQTIVITRMMLGILMIPLLLIMATIIGVLLTFVALSIHPLLALLVLVIAGGIIVGVARWEYNRASKEMAQDE